MSANLQLDNGPLVPGKYIAVAEFNATEDTQVSLTEGQTVTVSVKVKEERGWVYVERTAINGQKEFGYVPLNYLKKAAEGDLD